MDGPTFTGLPTSAPAESSSASLRVEPSTKASAKPPGRAVKATAVTPLVSSPAMRVPAPIVPSAATVETVSESGPGK
ncbi:MAG: hypothetical protein QM765_28595 [Myxococcales bacterium]